MLYLVGPDGEPGMLRRQCTGDFKVDAVRRAVRDLLGVGRTGTPPAGAATLVFGISWDESQRMRDSAVRYLLHDYPLIDRRLTRGDCILWLERHGHHGVPKSACIGCPYHKDTEWARMRDERPDEFADACAADDALRDGTLAREWGQSPIRGTGYLHRQRIPLRDVTFRTGIADGQGDLFAEECEGLCGV